MHAKTVAKRDMVLVAFTFRIVRYAYHRVSFADIRHWVSLRTRLAAMAANRIIGAYTDYV